MVAPIHRTPGPKKAEYSGYFVDTVGKNEKMIADYIKSQLEEDFAKDQISLKEFADPFTGVRNK